MTMDMLRVADLRAWEPHVTMDMLCVADTEGRGGTSPLFRELVESARRLLSKPN